MTGDIIEINGDEAQLQSEVTEIALCVLEKAGRSDLLDLLDNALENADFAEMELVRQAVGALPEAMRRNLLDRHGSPEESRQALHLLEQLLRDLLHGAEVPLP